MGLDRAEREGLRPPACCCDGGGGEGWIGLRWPLTDRERPRRGSDADVDGDDEDGCWCSWSAIV